jgi:hypothetical protein
MKKICKKRKKLEKKRKNGEQKAEFGLLKDGNARWMRVETNPSGLNAAGADPWCTTSINRCQDACFGRLHERGGAI